MKGVHGKYFVGRRLALTTHEPRGWWAESPDIDGWSVVGETYDEVRQLAEDGVPFALASAAEDRGEVFDEECFASVRVEHYVPAPA